MSYLPSEQVVDKVSSLSTFKPTISDEEIMVELEKDPYVTPAQKEKIITMTPEQRHSIFDVIKSREYRRKFNESKAAIEKINTEIEKIKADIESEPDLEKKALMISTLEGLENEAVMAEPSLDLEEKPGITFTTPANNPSGQVDIQGEKVKLVTGKAVAVKIPPPDDISNKTRFDNAYAVAYRYPKSSAPFYSAFFGKANDESDFKLYYGLTGRMDLSGKLNDPASLANIIYLLIEKIEPSETNDKGEITRIDIDSLEFIPSFYDRNVPLIFGTLNKEFVIPLANIAIALYVIEKEIEGKKFKLLGTTREGKALKNTGRVVRNILTPLQPSTSSSSSSSSSPSVLIEDVPSTDPSSTARAAEAESEKQDPAPISAQGLEQAATKKK